MLGNIWNNILDWFQDLDSRSRLVRDFNAFANEAFIAGEVPTLLKADMSRGDRNYKHRYSNWFQSGFRITTFSGRQLSKTELKNVGAVVLSNGPLVRKLVVLGWDTLEVRSDAGKFGLKWQLKDFALLS